MMYQSPGTCICGSLRLSPFDRGRGPSSDSVSSAALLGHPSTIPGRSSWVGQRPALSLLHLPVRLEGLFEVVFVAHDVSSANGAEETRLQCPAGRVRRSQPKINALSLPNPKPSRPAKST